MNEGIFFALAKSLEAERLENISHTTFRGNALSALDSDVVVNDWVPQDDMPEDQEWPVERWLRLQDEEDQANRRGNSKRTTTRTNVQERLRNETAANLSGRITCPPDEVRKRVQQSKPNNDDLVNELRCKQIELINEQIEVQKVLRETSLIQQEEAKERRMLVQAQTAYAELDLILKRREVDAANHERISDYNK